jgi:transposase
MISRTVATGAIAMLTLVGAGGHGSPRLKVPEKVVLLRLPPDALELNPIAKVWASLRSNYLSHRTYRDDEAIVDACCDAWNALTRMPDVITSITNRGYAQVKMYGRWHKSSPDGLRCIARGPNCLGVEVY